MDTATPPDRRLNRPQLEAVQADGHALCLLAGAGSGKTRVITFRIADLVQRRGADPRGLLAVTFTNKAAREMRERVDRLLPGCGRQLTVATFHAACARILREHGQAVGLSPHFTIYDEDDSARLLAQQLAGKGVDRQEARLLYRRIEQARNAGQGAADMPASDFDVPGRRARELLPAFEQALARADACDFAGLLLHVVRLLEAGGAEAQAIRERTRHLLVDEYQDSNKVQARLVHALGASAASVTVVGDDDQSIYGWRGAHPDNLHHFLQAFPQAQVIRLEQNYRSTRTILEAANAVIEKNPGRLPKRLFTEGPRGASLQIRAAEDERHEAQLIADQIDAWVRDGVPADEIAVLYRTNAQSRPVEEQLRSRRRAYRVVGGVRFYDRKEVKDLVAYLRLCLNPRSDTDLLRVLNVPARGIGDTTRLRLVEAARARGCTVRDLLDDGDALCAAGLRSAAEARARDFGALLRRLGAEVEALSADQATLAVARSSGLVEALEQQRGADAGSRLEAEDRLENIGALVSAAHDFVLEARRQGAPDTLDAFLESAALATDTDAVEGATDQPAVTLMTLHAAKGLEFDAVVLGGLEEGLFPQLREDLADPEERAAEERRLCYVGITRARRLLTLTHARSRQTFGELRYHRRSRFLDDLPRHLVQARATPPARPAWAAPARPGRQAAPPLDPGIDLDMDLAADFIDDEPVRGEASVEVGARVRHATFGEGVVLARDGLGPGSRLQINFRSVGRKKVVAKYVAVLEDASR